jgi:integrase
MRQTIQPARQVSEVLPAPLFSTQLTYHEDATMSLEAFVERRFIPNHVEFKRAAGRTHYQAILKHILMPETVDRLFAQYGTFTKARLRALPGWPYLDSVRLCDLNSDHVRRITYSAAVRGYSPQTVKHIRNVISAIVSHAKREGVISGKDYIATVELPPMRNSQTHRLTLSQAQSILQKMQYPEREVALIMISTGMSASEICALRWKDINATGAAIRRDGDVIPPRSIAIGKRRSAEGESLRSGNLTKKIELPEPLLHALARLRKRLNVSDPNSYVIETQGGQPFPANVRMLRLKAIGQDLQMPWLSWQVLRRAHDGLLSELKVQLADALVSHL